MDEAVAEYDRRVQEFSEQHPGLGDEKLATQIVDALPAKLHRQILLWLTVTEVASWRRAQARKVEESARACGESRLISPPATAPVDTLDLPHDVDLQRLYDDPALWLEFARPFSGPLKRDHRFDGYIGVNWWQREIDSYFRRWCDDTHGAGAFEGWIDRAIRLIEDDPYDWEEFERRWLPAIRGQIDRRQIADEYRRRYDEINQRLTDAMNAFADQIRLDVTTELLESIFATGDGTRVTWRDATVAQHEDRIELLTKMMTGTAETAAMHVAVIRMIKDAGVETLGDVA